ncbi:YjgN family protein [Uliginosibacterium sp. H3]|uniref:YjgN family protein n=1 Tax=Uliginosibacterium silvisoli TaxID=3114758 RepID=A0ABU6JXE9_9RHOO|nr:YjgN family protein [Uliginosibacterium sp. H3]
MDSTMEGGQDGGQESGQQAHSVRNVFVFTGRGSEYFRIWIVNLLLSIITLGIYSAWAKVRREQYFHRNTLLADSAFEYHGKPLSILKGRLLVVGLLFANNILGGLNPKLALAMGVVFLIVTPWIICQAVRFRAWNTSWRGVRLGFTGTYAGVAKVYFLNGLLVLVTLGLAAPWWLNRFQRYLVTHLRFGGEQFDSDAPTWDYYKPLLVLFAFFLAGVSVLVALFASTIYMRGASAPHAAVLSSLMFGTFIFYAGLYFIGGSYVRARLSNTLWNHTHAGPHQFESSYRARRLFWLMLTNTLAIVCTLGLFAPFAKVRMAAYRAETLALESTASLDEFVAHQEEYTRAIGDQAAELLDVDLGF